MANEELHLAAARALRLPVAEHRVVRDGHGVPGLLVTRFDRTLAEDGTSDRLAMEDAAQVLDVLPAAKYAVTSEEVALARRTARRADLRTLPFEGSPLHGALREIGHRRAQLEP